LPGAKRKRPSNDDHRKSDHSRTAAKSIDAHRDNAKRFVVRAEEKLTAFVELESAIRAATRKSKVIYRARLEASIGGRTH
jgi:hypothetical protein